MRHHPDQAATIKALGRVVVDLMARVRALEAHPRPTPIGATIETPPQSVVQRGIVHQLVSEAAYRCFVSEADIIGQSHKREFAWPRQWVMYEAQKRGLSYGQIGAVLNRDHTTVMSGVMAEKKRRGEV